MTKEELLVLAEQICANQAEEQTILYRAFPIRIWVE